MKGDPNPIELTAPPIDYQQIVFDCRSILCCGHVLNVVHSLRRLRARYNDALARIAQLEQQSPPNTTTHEPK